MTRVLVKQVKFLVVLNLSVSKPSHKYFPGALEKNSGKRSLILRVKRIEYNMLPKFLSFPPHLPLPENVL
jgi:hypothetical protein